MLRAASIGMGWWSDELADAVQGKSAALRIVTCFTRSAEKRAAFAEKYGTAMHDSYAGVLAVGHNRRYHGATRVLKAMVDDGALGTILHAEANFSVPSALTYPPDLWRADRVESPAGSITALGIHMIDALIYLLGPVARVSAQAHRRAVPVDIDDTTSALFTFESGASAYLGTLFACPHASFINIYGTAGNALAQIDSSRLTVHPAEGAAREESIEQRDTLRLELDEFAAACAGKARFTVAPEEAIHGIAVMEAIVGAAASGEWIAVQRQGRR